MQYIIICCLIFSEFMLFLWIVWRIVIVSAKNNCYSYNWKVMWRVVEPSIQSYSDFIENIRLGRRNSEESQNSRKKYLAKLWNQLQVCLFPPHIWTLLYLDLNEKKTLKNKSLKWVWTKMASSRSNSSLHKDQKKRIAAHDSLCCAETFIIHWKINCEKICKPNT